MVRTRMNVVQSGMADWMDRTGLPRGVLVIGTFHARGGGSGVEIHAPYYSAFFTRGGKLARVLSFRTEDEALRALALRE